MLNSFAKIIEILDADMPEPGMYGWYHIMWLFIVAIGTFLLCKFFGEGTDKQVKTIIHTVALTVAVFEIYKQINFTFSVVDCVIVADYQWYAFPFQFCDMPMYVGLLTFIFKKGKVHDALCSFLATYAIFAGVAVMLYPNTVFIETIGINIQTMVCHGGMIVVGVYLLYTGYVKSQFKTILKALPVFASCVSIATIMNEIAYWNIPETFNMFYNSRHLDSSLPVYGAIHNAVPFPIAFAIYIVGFTIAAFVVLCIAILIKRLCRKKSIV